MHYLVCPFQSLHVPLLFPVHHIIHVASLHHELAQFVVILKDGVVDGLVEVVPESVGVGKILLSLVSLVPLDGRKRIVPGEVPEHVSAVPGGLFELLRSEVAQLMVTRMGGLVVGRGELGEREVDLFVSAGRVLSKIWTSSMVTLVSTVFHDADTIKRHEEFNIRV